MTRGISVTCIKCGDERTRKREVGSFELLVYSRQSSNGVALLLIEVD